MILLSSAGNCDKDFLSSIVRIPSIGLHAQEVEFTHGVTMKNELAQKAGILAKEKDVKLSVHCPYYINLLSEDKEKRESSKKRILLSAERAHHMGAKNIVFHSGYYGKFSKKDAYNAVKEAILDMNDVIKKNKWDVTLCPETGGKYAQFCDTQTLLELKDDAKCGFTVDFAHIKACNNGKIDYAKVMDMFKGVKEIHSHYSGINFNELGEKNHLPIDTGDFTLLAQELLERKTNITIVCESPETWRDSLKMKAILEELAH